MHGTETTFAVQQNGYMAWTLSFPYMAHFERFTKSTTINTIQPARLLLLDGFKGHVSWQALDFGLKHNIHVMNLTAHTTHRM